MSLANRPIICKKLQFLVTNTIPSIWIQDSRFKAQKKLLQSNLFGFKIQGWRPSDSRMFFGTLNLESYPLGFKKSFWDLESWILNPTPLDSRSLFGILNLESYPLGFKKSFWDLESWILNPTPLDSRSLFGILNLESWILPPWIQEVFWGSWILNLGSDVLREGWDGNKIAKHAVFDHQKMP